MMIACSKPSIYKSVTMCPSGYHHNGFMSTPELGHRMYGYQLWFDYISPLHKRTSVYICRPLTNKLRIHTTLTSVLVSLPFYSHYTVSVSVSQVHPLEFIYTTLESSSSWSIKVSIAAQKFATSYWSIKVSIAAPKFAISTLMTTPLKVVTIECIEHDVTCLNERVFIKSMNHLLTNCSQSTSLAMVCRLSLLVLNTS